MKKAFGVLFFAAAALACTTASAQSNNSKGNDKKLQDTRPDQQVILAPSDQVPAAKDVPVIVTEADAKVKVGDAHVEDSKHRTKAEQRQHAEERSGGRAFSGKGND